MAEPDDDLRARRLAVLEQHFAAEVVHDWDAGLATFSLLRQIGREELLPLAGTTDFAADQMR